MARKNHALDEKILSAAKAEFMENGYETASLRKIAAEAGVTIGAIYTRYPTKDALFCTLVQPLLDRIESGFSSIRENYYRTKPEIRPDHMISSMQMESDAILHLLFDDYDRAILLLCRSTGRSLETYLDTIVERKISETREYLQSAGIPHLDENVLRMGIHSQFDTYFQIIRQGNDLSTAKKMMHLAIVYHTGGWLALLEILGQKGREEDLYEV